MSETKGLPPEILAALQDFENTKRGTKARTHARGRLYGVIGTALSARDAEIAAEAAAQEQKRCRDIVEAARFGEIDQDWRSVLYFLDNSETIQEFIARQEPQP